MNTKEGLLSQVLDPKRKLTQEIPNLFDRMMEGILERIPTYHPTLKQKILVGIVGVAAIAGGVGRYYFDHSNPDTNPSSPTAETAQESREKIIEEWDIDKIVQDDELLNRVIRGLPFVSSYASRK